MITREGRDALIRRDIDLAMFRAEAREFEFDGSSAMPLPALPTIDPRRGSEW